MLRRSPLFLALCAVVALALPSAAGAAATNVTGTVNAGALSLTSPATAAFSVTLDGTDQTGTYTLPLTLTDARGGGLGWNTTITSTQFASGPNTLPTTASTITGVSSVCVGGSTCTAPTNAITYPLAIPAAAVAPAAVKFFNAAANTGLGKFTLTPSVSVSVPASTLAGGYASTLTLASVSGP